MGLVLPSMHSRCVSLRVCIGQTGQDLLVSEAERTQHSNKASKVRHGGFMCVAVKHITEFTDIAECAGTCVGGSGGRVGSGRWGAVRSAEALRGAGSERAAVLVGRTVLRARPAQVIMHN